MLRQDQRDDLCFRPHPNQFEAPHGLAARVLHTVLDCGPNDWRSQFTAIRERWRIAGGSEKEREWLERRQQRGIRRRVRRAVDHSVGAKLQTH